ncbi:MAG: diaminopimelate decarboxylase [Pseudonocardia sp.]|nr:diaminopimelate decarboxylase [Pseudonocardia sp.]
MTLADLIPTLRPTLAARLEPGLWPVTAAATCDGRISVGGCDLGELAERHGTPLQVLDVVDVRDRCRAYTRALPDAEITYAGKALLTPAVARLVAAEGLSIDTCSGGEVRIAAAAGVPGERILLHGNVKTDADLRAAGDAGVGRIVIDSFDEIARIAEHARGVQDVMIRVTPGVDAHTLPGLTTGTVNQQFGLPFPDAAIAAKEIGTHPQLRLVGLHCHLGSQITSTAPYVDALHRVVGFAAEQDIDLRVLDMGGGHAVDIRGDAHDGPATLDPKNLARDVLRALHGACAYHRIPVPRLVVEPGRAIVARAGVTLYRVWAVKHIGDTTFVAVDGGMSDNPRPALYGARYPVRRIGKPVRAPLSPMTVVGRHCESTDRIAEGVPLPADIAAGDLVAVPCTGAYTRSMASTYNAVAPTPMLGVGAGAALPI